jgi:hypothetical protein
MNFHRSLGKAGALDICRPDFPPVDADCCTVSHHKSSSVGILASGQVFHEADFTLWRMNIQYIKNQSSADRRVAARVNA